VQHLPRLAAPLVNGGILLQLVLILAPLSLVAVGGAIAVLPEIHRQVVQVYGWMSDAEFADLFALAQAAPGPNVLVVSFIGWKVAGAAGALVALLALCVPSSVLAYATARAWRRFRDAPWRRAVQTGLAPLSVGLVLASGAILTQAADTSLAAYAITAATALLVLRTRFHPLLFLAVAAALAVAGWL
jgi:chromate transporter